MKKRRRTAIDPIITVTVVSDPNGMRRAQELIDQLWVQALTDALKTSAEHGQASAA